MISFLQSLPKQVSVLFLLLLFLLNANLPTWALVEEASLRDTAAECQQGYSDKLSQPSSIPPSSVDGIVTQQVDTEEKVLVPIEAAEIESPLPGEHTSELASIEPASGAAASGDSGVGLAVAPSPVVLRGQVGAIEALNRDILLKEIELERYAINFRKKNNVQGRWRGWRYFLSQEANAALTGSGLLYQALERQRIINVANDMVLDKNGKITYKQRTPIRARLENGLAPQMIGQIIGATGSSVELSINMFHEYQSRKAGYAPKEGIKRVLAMKAELEDLFERRRRLVDSGALSAEDRALALAEEKVLKDITAMGLHEYVAFHVGARRFRAFQDSLYVLDILKNSVGAVGNGINIKGLHENHPNFNGPGGICTFISGCLIVATPLVSRACGKVVGTMHSRALRGVTAGIPQCDLATLEKDKEDLMQLVKARGVVSSDTCSAQTLALLSSYERQSGLRKGQLELATREIRSGTRSATENVIVGTGIGAAKMSLGICLMRAGFVYQHFNHKANSVLQGGTIAYCVGSFVGVGDNIRLRVQDEINRYKLGKKRQLPMQVLGDRLKALDEIETSLKTCSKSHPLN